MSECTNKEVGNLLHAYEIGILSEQEREQFEVHMLGCEHCHSLLTSFEERASLLTTSESVKAIVKEALPRETSEEPILSRLWRVIWPKAPIMLRPAVAYAVILLLLIPAYHGLRKAPDDRMRSVQSVHLLPGRSMTGDALKVSLGDDGLLSFVLRGAVAGEDYAVTILREDDEEIFRDNSFTGFDQYETGRLLLPLAQMEPGAYRLVVSDPRAEPSLRRWEYSFRIE